MTPLARAPRALVRRNASLKQAPPAVEGRPLSKLLLRRSHPGGTPYRRKNRRTRLPPALSAWTSSVSLSLTRREPRLRALEILLRDFVRVVVRLPNGGGGSRSCQGRAEIIGTPRWSLHYDLHARIYNLKLIAQKSIDLSYSQLSACCHVIVDNSIIVGNMSHLSI